MPNNKNQKPSGNMPQVRNVGELKMLLNQYGGLLTPENRQMIGNLLGELEKGADPASLSKLAGQMQQSAAKQQQNIPNAARKQMQNSKQPPKRRK